MKKILSIFIICFCFGACVAKNVHQIQLDNAEGNFKKGNFSKTIEIYESLVQVEKVNNPYIYYNLSNAYYRNGEVGKAVLNIEKALKLAPRNKEIKSNAQYLYYISGNIKRKKIYNIFTNHFSLNEITILFSSILILFIIILSLFIVKPNLMFKKIIISLIIVLFFFTFLLVLKGWEEFSSRKAIVLTTSNVRSGPSENNVELFTIPEGRVISVIAKNGNWNNIKVDLEDETLTGWILSANIGSVM
ncbi:MAG: SH3 domain-containing protein [Endomicrobium sp.]|jgi:hypothetical protein|nr:SH3 domain-containing protein [Endomicrobium sp.]